MREVHHAAHRRRVSERIRVQVPAERLHLFNAVTGDRLALVPA
jgi:hypothetical protein